jgi:hypothetical protein
VGAADTVVSLREGVDILVYNLTLCESTITDQVEMMT